MVELNSEPQNQVRIQKWLSDMGLASRREADRLVVAGMVYVNEVRALVGQKIDPALDRVRVEGTGKKLNSKAPKVYWLMNKPDRTLVSRKSQGGNMTIFDLPMLKKVGFPISSVGRLDYRTEGLLLLSNDGELIYRLTHPKFKIPKVYQVLIKQRLSSAEEALIRKGITLEDGLVSPSLIDYFCVESKGAITGHWYKITVFEGRNHLVRRIFESFDKPVLRLVRVGLGSIKLPAHLPQGKYQQLSACEIQTLLKLVSLDKIGNLKV